jgi:hypothetical protein
MAGSDEALALLMSRSSSWPKGEPAPTPDQVAPIARSG